MRRSAAGLLLLSALAAALAACAPDKGPKVESNVYPADYKLEIIDTLKQAVFEKNDTIKITNAFVSEPALQQIGTEQHYVSCVRYTSHGAEYNLIGTATRKAYFYGGHINQLVQVTEDECAKAAYKPFLELDQVCLGKGCQ